MIGRKVPALVLVAALAVTTSACAAKDNGGAFSAPPVSTGPVAATDPAAARLLPAAFQSSRELKAGVEPVSPPLAFLQGGSVEGIDADLMQAIGAKLGLKITLVQHATGGEADVLLPGPPSATGPTPPPADVVVFLQIGFSTLVKSGTSSVCGGPVAVTPNAPSTLPPGCDRPRQSVATLADGVADLQAGRVAAVVTDYAGAVYQVQTAGGGKALALAGGPVDPRPVGFVVPPGGLHDALQAALASVMADGTYRQILATWGLQAAAVG